MNIPVLAMIHRSGFVAQVVLLILTVFSVITWAIIIDRFRYFGSNARLHRRFRRLLDDSARLADLNGMDQRIKGTPMGQLGLAGTAEVKRIIDDAVNHREMKDWSFFLNSQFSMARDLLDTIVTRGLSRFDRGLMMLALMSSASPFLGLFGTVWGVMDSFFQIGSQGSTSLQVVAPGIAEALVTTAFGLGVAIPAVMFYNAFAKRVERVEDQLEEAKELVLLRLKREVLMQFYGGEGGTP